jgi:glycosyltransferase
MKVSIITASFNNQDTIEGTIQSVLGQTYPDIEYIVVDGGSTDETKAIIASYAGQIDKVISEKDRGIYDALNKGIRAATGDVIGFLHADDLYNDNSAIARVVAAFKDKDVDSVYSDLVYVDKKHVENIIRYWESGPFERGRLKHGWCPPHLALWVKRTVYERYGTFDMFYSIAADYDIMLRFFWDHRISAAYIPDVLIRMRLGGTSNRGLGNLLRKSSEDLKILKRHKIPLALWALIAKNISKLPQFVKARTRHSD